MVEPWHDDTGRTESGRNGERGRLMQVSVPAVSPSARLPLIDAARGITVAAMVIYHFCWDLRYFGYIASDVEGALPWRIFAHATAGAFLFIVGIGLVLSTRNGFDRRRFLRRLGVLVAASAAITIATYFIFPDSYIFFGVLHHIAVASVLGLAFLRTPILIVIGAAIACFFAPLLASPAFDTPALLWLGLAPVFPRTNDFVPLFPWFGVVLAGIAATRLWLLYGPRDLPILHASVPRPILWTGRQSLLIYLLHQPILFGAVYLATLVAPPPPIEFAPWFSNMCGAQCAESELDSDECQQICDCVGPKAEAAGLSAPLFLGQLTDDQNQEYSALIGQCEAASPPP